MRTPDGSSLAPRVDVPAAMAGSVPEMNEKSNEVRRGARQERGVMPPGDSGSATGKHEDGREAKTPATHARPSARTPRSAGLRSANSRAELPRYRAGPRNSSGAPQDTAGEPPTTDWAGAAAHVQAERKAAAPASSSSPAGAGNVQSSDSHTGSAALANGVKRAGRGRVREGDPPRQRQPVVSRSRLKASTGASSTA